MLERGLLFKVMAMETVIADNECRDFESTHCFQDPLTGVLIFIRE